MTTEEILQDSVFYQEIKETGRREMARQMIERMLMRRFGVLPHRLRQRIAAADSATLERWADQLITAPTADAALR